MGVSTVPALEVRVEALKIILALCVCESMGNSKVYEDYVGVGSNSVYCATLIPCLGGSQQFPSRVSDNFLVGGIVLMMLMPILICPGAMVMPKLIVVAFSRKEEPPNHGSNLLIV